MESSQFEMLGADGRHQLRRYMALLAYDHAGARQRTRCKVAGGDRANQRGESPLFAVWQETARSGGSPTAT